MRRKASILALALAMASGGCVGVTNKITGSSRAGAEQILLTSTADKAIESIDFSPLAGHQVFLDTTQLSGTDSGWLVFDLRRQMARQGLLLAETKKDAQIVVEASVAAYGTDEVDCKISLPSSFVMGMLPIPTGSSTTDTGGLLRKSKQDAVVKMALFAYDAKTRQLVWETDDVMQTSHLDRRFFGTSNITRNTSVPELEVYPPRQVRVR